MSKRIILRAELTTKAKSALDKMGVDRGMSNIQVFSRSIEFVASMPKNVQAIIMGQVEGNAAKAVLAILK